MVPSARTRCNGHKVEHGRFPLTIKKDFFTVWVMGPWHGVPREVLECPSLKIFKSRMDIVLGNLL